MCSFRSLLCLSRARLLLLGGHGAVVLVLQCAVAPPVPVPNTVVKRRSADTTAGATRWDDRPVPGQHTKAPAREPEFFSIIYQRHATAVAWQRVGDCGRVAATSFAMVTAIARIDLALYGCRSLKDKRQILRSIIERTRVRYQVAIAEVEDQDLWQRAVLGIAYVSASGGHAEEVVQKVVEFISTAHAEAEVLDAIVESVAPF
jgi:uncharacterized protein YlxP (DUF503 family)